MQIAARNKLTTRGIPTGPTFLACMTLAITVAACSNDPIVYPNRNLRAAAGGDTGESGAAGEAGETGSDSGGALQGGSGGAKAGSGGVGGKGGSGGKAGNGGGAMAGPVCGDGKVEAPEECDDGNTISGDGCSWDCRTACEICEQNVCPQFDFNVSVDSTPSAYNDCFKVAGKIKTGPATGYPRAQVCQELVDCIREEECSQTKGPRLIAQKCWCDTDWNNTKGVGGVTPVLACKTDPDPKNPTDPKKFIPGKCASLFQDASEFPGLNDVLAGLVAIERPEGAALRLVAACDTRECTEECVPKYFNARGLATITEDIVAQRNAAGESPLGDIVADSQRLVATADFALVHPNFVHTQDGVPDLTFAASEYRAADAPGRVLWSEALRVNFGHGRSELLGQSGNEQTNSTLYKVTYTGQQIYDALNQQFGLAVGGMLYVSGLSYDWDAAQPFGSKVLNVFKAGSQTPLDKTATYTVAVTSFLTDPNGTIPVLSKGTNPTQVTLNDISQLLGEYLQQLPQPVAPPELNRIKRLN
jgi:cysteine-rich repeat protein